MIKSLKNTFFQQAFGSDYDRRLAEFKSLYEEHSSFIHQSIYWMIRSDDVEDLVQESFVKAWKNFHQFQHGSSFRTWIYRIAMNTCYDYLKKKKPDYLSDVSEQVVGEDSLSDRDLIDRALLGLSPKMREVFILYYKFNYKLNEIASMLDCSEGTVKSRLYKAKEIFSKFVEQNGGYRE